MYVKQGMDLRPYDADDLDHELWQFSILREISMELKEEDFNRISEVIAGVSDNANYKAARQRAKETSWQHQGEAENRILDFMLETEDKKNSA